MREKPWRLIRPRRRLDDRSRPLSSILNPQPHQRAVSSPRRHEPSGVSLLVRATKAARVIATRYQTLPHHYIDRRTGPAEGIAKSRPEAIVHVRRPPRHDDARSSRLEGGGEPCHGPSHSVVPHPFTPHRGRISTCLVRASGEK